MNRRRPLTVLSAASLSALLLALAGVQPTVGQGTPETPLPAGAGSSGSLGSNRSQTAPEPLTRIRVGLSLPREVAVFAPNYYARELADDILRQKHVTETTLKRADAILVVFRSTLANPLHTSYGCPCDLRRDTSARAGFAGQKTHVYVYTVDENLRVRRVAHDVRIAPSSSPSSRVKPPL